MFFGLYIQFVQSPNKYQVAALPVCKTQPHFVFIIDQSVLKSDIWLSSQNSIERQMKT